MRAVEIVLPAASIPVGGTVDLRAIVRNAAGTELGGRDIRWSTADSALAGLEAVAGATVRVRGRVPGTARVSASSERVDNTVEIIVTGPVETVEVVPATSVVVQGANTQFQAYAKDARSIVIVNPSIRWSTSNPAVVTVTAAGLVSAVGAGTAQVTATVDGKSGVGQVTVTAAPVATVAVTPDPATVAVDRSVQFRASVKDAAGNELGGRPVVWSSSNTAVLSIDASGTATGRAVGTVTVTATSDTKSGTAQVSVVPPSALVIEVTPSSRAVDIGDTLRFEARLRDGNGNYVSGRPVSWVSSDPGVAAMSGSLAAGMSPGIATITASADGQTGNAQLSVRAPAPAVSAITPDTVTAGRAADLSLAVTGSGFTRTSRIRWNGTDRPTTFVNDGRLTGMIPASDLAAAGTAQVTVFTPAPGGGTSTPRTFRIRGTGTYAVGDTATGEINPAGNVDEYTFAGIAGQEVNVYLQATSGSSS
ncbi:MAG TPA: Ig-like domain-containing protein, partial [Longimicrobium sp.]|nr:Ig-like domain-containing protein [Longimicrobium sp.]